MEVYKKLRNAREFRGIKQKDLAKKIGISQTSLSLIETGDKHPHFKTLLKILKELNYSLIIIPNEHFKQ